MELLQSARRLGDFPTRFVLWRAWHARDTSILNLYIDALEDYVAALTEVCDTINSMRRTLRRALRDLERQRQKLVENVARFHEEGKDDLAHMAQHRVLTMNHQEGTYQRLLAAQEQELAAYQEVRLILEATLSEARQRREEIEAWQEARAPDAYSPDFARPLPEWDEEQLARELEDILGIERIDRAAI